MLRLLGHVPPGKVRFTIIDPVGLGENFAGFMHLADFDDVLVTNRIWTEPQQIEARLADLTEQMENVIQKYLRNDFETIAEYNEFAGEVAEAFRILVVANFPVNFTETAARRLTSIAASGARCGVLRADDRRRTSFAADAVRPSRMFERHSDESGLGRRASSSGKIAGFRQVSARGRVSRRRKSASRRSCSSSARMPRTRGASKCRSSTSPRPTTTGGAGSTSHGIDVPLGRAGATKLQHLRLGHGTSQHVLIAGKTGSGKSTLLHALITNLALTYSPAEIELYLIDFKKGVEFKTYATHELPHARVIAIESEREFGLSVLQKLDAELKRRGDLFRESWRARSGRLSRRPSRADDAAADPADRRRISRIVRRRRQDRSRVGVCCWTGSCGKVVRSACTCCSARKRSAGRTAWPAARSARWRCASPCNAARTTRI